MHTPQGLQALLTWNLGMFLVNAPLRRLVDCNADDLLPQGSMNHHRVLRQLGVLLQRVFNFFLGRGFELPGRDVHLKQLGP